MKLHRFIDAPLAMYDIAAAEMLQEFHLRFRQQRPLLFVDQIEEVPAAVIPGNAAAPTHAFDVIDGVAVIPISGVLMHSRLGWADETTYSTIQDKIIDAVASQDVNAVALQIASPGGEVSGLFELADTIHSLRGSKPIWSILDDHAYSAAYAIASATDRITVPRTGGVGSVGVITMHLDISELLEDYGINVSLIHYGERKTDYSLFKPLSDKARDKLQGDVNDIGVMFVDMVARNRKDQGLTRQRVKATEAGIFMGKAGVEAGFADAVMSPAEAFRELATSVKP